MPSQKRYIKILGSNDNKIKLITDKKIESIIENQELLYNLYKTKYLQSCINTDDTNLTNHLLKQLITTFYKYNEKLSNEINLKDFIKYINFLTKCDVILLINTFLLNNNLLDNLEKSIKIILIKILQKKYNKEIKDIQLNNNYKIDISYTLQTIETFIQSNKDKYTEVELKKINKYIKKIHKKCNKLHNLLNDIKKIKLKTDENDLILKQNKSCKFIQDLITKLDLLLLNINSIKNNILEVDSILNLITELFSKLYLIL